MSWFKKKNIPVIDAKKAKEITVKACQDKVHEGTKKVFDYIMEDISVWLAPKGHYHKTFDIEGILDGQYITLSETNKAVVTAEVALMLRNLGYTVTEKELTPYWLTVDWS